MTDYGTTFLLDSSGDLQLNEVNQLKMTSTNTEKVSQDVRITLKTIKSGDIFSPQFGFDLLKIKQYTFNRILIDAEIQTALKKYQYFKSIDKIVIDDPDANRLVHVDVNLTTTSDLLVAIGVAF